MKSQKNNLVHARQGDRNACCLSGSLESGERPAGVLFILFLFLIISPAMASVSSVQTPEDQILAKGFAAYMDGRDKQAQSYFEEVIRLNPRNSAAQKGLDKVKVRLRRKEDDDRERALVLARARVKEGRQLMKSKDVVGAIDSFHAAIDAVPAYKPAVNEMNSIRKQTEKELKRPRLNLSVFAYNRGVLAYLDRDWAKAYRIWSERTQMDPNNVPMKNAALRAENNFRRMMITERKEFFRRGARAFYEQGLYAQSKESWAKVLEIDPEDVESLEGKARAENALLDAQGKSRDTRVHDLLAQALDYYAQQSWRKSMELFKQIVEVDPEFTTAQEYIAKLNEKLTSGSYVGTSSSGGGNFRPTKSSNQNVDEEVDVPENVENLTARKAALESQLKRDPSNIRIQQELDKISRMQEEESERIYKDGLIAYSQGNRSQAIQKWKQVLVINPDHKKALAALKKARAEEERTTPQEEE